MAPQQPSEFIHLAVDPQYPKQPERWLRAAAIRDVLPSQVNEDAVCIVYSGEDVYEVFGEQAASMWCYLAANSKTW